MPVRLVTGSRAALERAFADEVARLKAPDPLAPLHVLVGGTLMRPYLRRVLADRLGGVLDVHLLTPGELGLALGQHALLAAGRRPMPFLADRVLAARAAVEVPGAYAPVSDLPGFPATLARTLRDLRFAGVSPDALQLAADAEPDAGDPDAVRLRSLAAIHGHVSEARAGRFGPEDAFAAADPSRLGDHGLLVFGVWETTAVLRHALRAIATAGAPLTLFTPRAGPAPDDALRALWSFALELGATRQHVDTPGAGGSDCARTKASLFGPAPAQRFPDGSVALVSAPDPEREVREVVRACVGWADEGIGFHEMAIAYRDGATYRPLLDAALRDAQIAAYVHEGTPILERPVGRRVAALLALADARDNDGALRLERSSVVELLADARLPDATFERYGRPSVPRWEAISRNASVVHGRGQWEERLAAYDHELAERYARENGGAPLWVAERREAVAHLASFVGDLAAALEARPGRGRWSAHVDWLLGLLERYVDDAGAIAGAVADLAQLDAITGDVDPAGFLGAVTALLEGLRDRDVLGARQGAFGLRGITVVDVNSLRHLGFRAVAIVGVAERVFPPPPREDPLLLDARRQQLEAGHGLELALRARGGDPEPLQFHTAVQAAGERVLISFARTATDGRGQLPSVFFRAAAETMAGERVTVERVDAGDVPGLRRLASGRLTPTVADTALTATERRRALLESRASGAVELVRYRLPRTVAGARAIRSRAERTATPFDGVLSSPALDALGDVPRFGRVLSPTSLETYARCPHRHLLSGVLGLRELEEPEAITRISALDKGDAVHRILESFLRERPAGPLDPSAERERLHAVAAPILRELEDQGRTGYPLLWDVDRIQILEDLERWLELDLASIADGSPRYAERGFEVRFGSHGRPEPGLRDALTRDDPLELPLPSGHVLRIGGYVDRVDHDGIGSRRFEVIDYKTGGMYKMKDEALRGGSQLQLGLYLLAVAQALGVPAERGVARYVSVDRKAGFGQFSYPGTLLEGDEAPLYALLDELVAARGAGDFHREPDDCKFCPVKGACEPRRVLLHTRKAADPALVAHKARQETYP